MSLCLESLDSGQEIAIFLYATSIYKHNRLHRILCPWGVFYLQFLSNIFAACTYCRLESESSAPVGVSRINERDQIRCSVFTSPALFHSAGASKDDCLHTQAFYSLTADMAGPFRRNEKSDIRHNIHYDYVLICLVCYERSRPHAGFLVLQLNLMITCFEP